MIKEVAIRTAFRRLAAGLAGTVVFAGVYGSLYVGGAPPQMPVIEFVERLFGWTRGHFGLSGGLIQELTGRLILALGYLPAALAGMIAFCAMSSAFGARGRVRTGRLVATCVAFVLAYLGYYSLPIRWLIAMWHPIQPLFERFDSTDNWTAGRVVYRAVCSITDMPVFWLSLGVFGLMTYPARDSHSSCLKCGYNLTGNESGRCPECGKDVEACPNS